jgi:hypothetical protein
VFESYVATPGCDMPSSGVGAMMAATVGVGGQNERYPKATSAVFGMRISGAVLGRG